jgi:dienelactone hydrolase
MATKSPFLKVSRMFSQATILFTNFSKVMPRNVVLLIVPFFLSATVGCTTTQPGPSAEKLLTEDSIQLEFDYYPAHHRDSPAVILLPDTRCDRRAFGALPAKLNQAGFAVLTMDLRYKDLIAKSGDIPKQIQTIQKQDLNVLVDQDVKSAIDFLSQQDEVDLKRLCLIGTSLGSRVALKAGVKYSTKALVLVSLSGKDVFTVGSDPIQQALSEYGDKLILFMTSERDWGNNHRAAEDNKLYLNWVKGKSELKIWPGSAHGMGIIKMSDASEFLVSWLRQNI